ncbi:MAG: ShlB/FhaC/HecB family hemolysin secretion/activation protein, partial [Alkalinema sp. RU_4_3]|nr:ShlB/FhaC/HecB family hemolysin secretion/activation protein [Alkalinema sp. RU_4_3]
GICPPSSPSEKPEDILRRQQIPPTTLPGSPTPPSQTPDKPMVKDRPEVIAPGDQTFTVKRFVLTGSQVFSQAEIDRVTVVFLNTPITFAQVLEARSKITELYVSRGYITTGAYIPEQDFQEGGDLQIAVVEGSIESIDIQGNGRLNSGYLRSRVALGAKTPLNREQLLEGLQLLRINPLLSNLSATLEGGSRPGKSILSVKIKEAASFATEFSLNNNRSPSVGSFRRGVQVNEANLLGYGDGLTIGYGNTDGSQSWDFSYSLPVSPRDTTLSFNFGVSNSDVIERPFDALQIESASRYYELTLRHPLRRTLTSELAMGLTFSRRESQTKLGFENIGPFPLSAGADDQGRTKVSAVRFFRN